MQILINGVPREVSAHTTLTALLDELQLEGRLAVEVNEAIVPRGRFADYQLQEGDRVEIVRAIGGG